VQTIKEDTEKKAILEALINYDRRLETYPPEQVLPLLREVTFSDEGFVPETEVYCAKVTGIMYPVEVLGTLVAAEETAVSGKSEFSIDWTQYEIGDLPEELGRNLIIGETQEEGKYITAQTQEPLGEIELNELLLSNTFEFIMQVDWSQFFSTSGTGSIKMVDSTFFRLKRWNYPMEHRFCIWNKKTFCSRWVEGK